MTDRQEPTEPMEDPDISRVYQGTRREQPSAQLDAKILDQAQAAARQRRRRWLLPLSSAALVLLGLTFTLKLLEQAPQLEQIDAGFDAEQPAETKAQRQLEERSVPPAPAMLQDSLSEPVKRKSSRSAPAAASSLGGVSKLRSEHAPLEALEFDEKSQEGAKDPAEWLARIEALQDHEEFEKAREELQAFTAAFPDYPLTPRLRGLLVPQQD